MRREHGLTYSLEEPPPGDMLAEELAKHVAFVSAHPDTPHNPRNCVRCRAFAALVAFWSSELDRFWYRSAP